jgi:hypothetical protein
LDSEDMDSTDSDITSVDSEVDMVLDSVVMVDMESAMD